MIKIGFIADIHNAWEKFPIADRIRGTERAVLGERILERLSLSVKKINKEDVDFVVVLGDLTGSGLSCQFQEVKEVLDNLDQPVIPLLGNHDIVPSIIKGRKIIWESKEGTAEGLRLFRHHFNDYFQLLRGFFEDWEEQGKEFQNYAWTFRGVRFVVIDNVNRRHNLFGLPGVAPWSQFHPQSRVWLEKQLSSAEKIKIVFSHISLKKRVVRETGVINFAGHRHKKTQKKIGEGMIITLPALYLKPLFLVAKISPETGIILEERII